jgi:NAD(P)-dependent dehydrogenase (short-subunit alcohol dehydrogenase family)
MGRAFAVALAERGAHVAIVDLEDGAETVARVREAGSEGCAFRADVADEGEVDDAVARTCEALGRVDVLVANAGIFTGLQWRPFLDITPAEWDRVMRTNARGPFVCARAVLPAMIAQGYGRIVNVASATVFKGTSGFPHYVASKGAVVALTRSLARG